MKKTVIIVLIVIAGLFSIQSAFADSFSLGVSLAAGGRYDNVRMCVASDAGVPGGPAMEPAALVFEYSFNENFGMGAYIPVGRPILFGTAFRMLQFLPELVFNFHIPINDTVSLAFHPAVGASLHYGPDYLSDQENRGEDFFAMGPRFSMLGGVTFLRDESHEFTLGLKPYFEYLMTENPAGRDGFVVGGELDFQYRYRFELE